jgi:hypothetical protein
MKYNAGPAPVRCMGLQILAKYTSTPIIMLVYIYTWLSKIRQHQTSCFFFHLDGRKICCVVMIGKGFALPDRDTDNEVHLFAGVQPSGGA